MKYFDLQESDITTALIIPVMIEPGFFRVVKALLLLPLWFLSMVGYKFEITQLCAAYLWAFIWSIRPLRDVFQCRGAPQTAKFQNPFDQLGEH